MPSPPRAPTPVRPFKPGDQVTVFSVYIFRRPFIEGRATIIKPLADDPDFYLVQFEGEKRCHERLVQAGEWQTDPERHLERLRKAWLVTMTPELLAEFFPDDLHHAAHKRRTGT